MNYDVVIATRNRPEALRVSIPLILGQNRIPKKLVIVDSSDDHEKVRQTIISLVNGSGVQLEIVHSKANLPYQRNRGLEYVDSPVVVYPDDDSLWWPGVAESIMKVYDRDIEHMIAGVCATWAIDAPPQAGISKNQRYQMTRTDRIKQKLGGWRYRIENFICPNPLYIHGRTQWSRLIIPQWLKDVNAVPIEYMNGLCMTFRTEVIRKYGFDSDLGSHVGWAPCEDVAASFAVIQEFPVVRACDAMVCHYTFPSPRSGGYRVGFLTQLNRAYVLCYYAAVGSPAYRALRRFASYKMLQYILGIHSRYGRERLRGHIHAMFLMKKLRNTPINDLRKCYLEICQNVLGSD